MRALCVIVLLIVFQILYFMPKQNIMQKVI